MIEKYKQKPDFKILFTGVSVHIGAVFSFNVKRGGNITHLI